MKKLFLLWFAVGALALSPMAGVANATDIISDAQGWISSAGNNNGGINGNNTFTGNEYGNRYNSWAQFDLTSVAAPVSEATLLLNLATWPSGDQALYTLEIYNGDAKTYDGLMSGDLYGTVTGNNGQYYVTLSDAAIADINDHLGGIIVFGFTNATLNAGPSNSDDDFGIYINGYYGNAEMAPVLQLTEGSAPVPEPASFLLLGAGLAGLAARRKSKK